MQDDALIRQDSCHSCRAVSGRPALGFRLSYCHLRNQVYISSGRSSDLRLILRLSRLVPASDRSHVLGWRPWNWKYTVLRCERDLLTSVLSSARPSIRSPSCRRVVYFMVDNGPKESKFQNRQHSIVRPIIRSTLCRLLKVCVKSFSSATYFNLPKNQITKTNLIFLSGAETSSLITIQLF